MMTVSTSGRQTSAALWRVRAVTLVLAALAAASVVFWGLKIGAPTPVQVSAAALTTAQAEAVDWAASARALGAKKNSEAPAARALNAQRWVLTGVVRAGTSEGMALIAAEGQPAKPYRLKSRLEEGLFLVALEPRLAHLGPSPEGPVSISLTLPKLREP
jgi:general secretion pathway protein C